MKTVRYLIEADNCEPVAGFSLIGEESMSRITRLGDCARCKERPATVGVCRSYYAVKDRKNPEPGSRATSSKQFKGQLPTLAFCAICFVDFATKTGLDESALDLIRRELLTADFGSRRSPVTDLC